MAKYIDDAINRYVAEEHQADVREWFLIVYVESRDGEKSYLRLKPADQDPHHTGGLIQHAGIKHEEYVKGMGT